MAGENIRKMLTLRHQNLTQAVVAKTLGVKPATVSRWYAKADKLNLDFEKARTMTSEALEDLFNSKPGPKSSSTWPVDLNKVDFALELGKTIDETYEDYLAEAAKSNCLLQPLKRAAYFSRVKKHRDHLKACSRAMMMVWGPGKYMQIDLAGDTILIGPDSDGKITTVTVFVGTLPASGLVFAWALAETTTKDWNEGIVKMFNYIGGVPEIVLCDNAKALVVNATPGCQVFTDDFADLAGKYGFQIECALPGKPKHKGHAENAVGRITKMVINRIKPCTLKTIEDVQLMLDAAIAEINGSPNSKTGIVPWDDFREREKNKLKPIPAVQWTRHGARHRRLIDDYGCVNIDGHKYLCDPDYDLGSIDVVISGKDEDGNEDPDGVETRKLLFMRPNTDKILWDYPYNAKGKSHPTEGTRHAKMEFRLAHETTGAVRLSNAKEKVASMGPMAANYVAAFAKYYEHKVHGMTAQKLDWIYNKLKGFDKDVAERAFKHALELGNLDKDRLIDYAGLIRDFLAKEKESRNPQPSTRGACLHRMDSFVPPAPLLTTGSNK